MQSNALAVIVSPFWSCSGENLMERSSWTKRFRIPFTSRIAPRKENILLSNKLLAEYQDNEEYSKATAARGKSDSAGYKMKRMGDRH
jgi:hypothetical protein